MPPENSSSNMEDKSESALNNDSTEPKTEQTTSSMEPKNTLGNVPEASKKKSRKLLPLVGVLLVMGAAVAGYVVLGKDSTKDTKQVAQAEVKNDIALLKVGLQTDNIQNELPENDNNYGPTTAIFYQTHEALVAFEDSTQLKPRIAESWTNPDSVTWSFKIANNRTFHTGKKLTAKDVVASLKVMKESGFWDTNFVTVDTISLDPMDDSVLIIKTRTPDAVLLNRLSLLPIYDVEYKPGMSWASGTGAYTLKEGSAPTKDGIELVAVDSYPLGRPYVRAISYINHSDDKTYADNVVAGKFDIANIEAIETTKLDQNLDVRKLKSLGSFFASLNNDRPNGPLRDKKVREALSHIIQGKEFVDVADSEIATQIVPPEVPGYTTAIKGYAYDLEKAKSLLVEAGYKKPSDLTLRFGYLAGAQDNDAVILVAQLKAAGITVVEESASKGSEFIKQINNEQYDIILYSYSTGINDLTDIALDVAGSAGLYKQYANPAIDALVATANAEFDRAKRLVKLQDINKAIAEDYGIIPLRTSIYDLVIRKDIVCKEDNGQECYFWKTYSTK